MADPIVLGKRRYSAMKKIRQNLAILMERSESRIITGVEVSNSEAVLTYLMEDLAQFLELVVERGVRLPAQKAGVKSGSHT